MGGTLTGEGGFSGERVKKRENEGEGTNKTRDILKSHKETYYFLSFLYIYI